MLADRAKISWQMLSAELTRPPVERVRTASLAFERLIRRRNLIEYAAAIFVVAAFGAYVVWLPGVLVKVGSALVVLATPYVIWRCTIGARSSPIPRPPGCNRWPCWPGR